jgi:hypothetical protein
MATPAIRHVRYADFIALVSAGARDLEGFRRAIDELVRDMGMLHAVSARSYQPQAPATAPCGEWHTTPPTSRDFPGL